MDDLYQVKTASQTSTAELGNDGGPEAASSR